LRQFKVKVSSFKKNESLVALNKVLPNIYIYEKKKKIVELIMHVYLKSNENYKDGEYVLRTGTMKPARECRATTYAPAPPRTSSIAQPNRILIPAN
jgi:hypothetical protein